MKAVVAVLVLLAASVPTELHSQAYAPPTTTQLSEPSNADTLLITAHAAYRRGDYATAETALRSLADQGNPQGQAELATMYVYGQGVPANYAEALRLYRAAADKGNADAQAGLGYMYASGRGVQLDNAIAASWYRKAAEAGNAYARRNLSNLIARYPALDSPAPDAGAASSASTPSDQDNIVHPANDLQAAASDSSLQPVATSVAPSDAQPIPAAAPDATTVSDNQPPSDAPAQSASPSQTSSQSGGAGGAVIIVILIIFVVAVLARRKPRSANPPNMAKTRPTNARPADVRTQRSAPPPFSKSTANWQPPGTPVTIAGQTIPDGMVYVGRTPPYQSGGSGCVIDPSLPIAAPSADRVADKLNYWPSYREVSPSCRGRYLAWLSSGKCDPEVDLGYVFLYFYGLERRLLVDQPSSTEEAILVAEVVRLRSIYAGSGSFEGYSQGLLDAVEVRRWATDQDAERDFQPDLMRRAGTMSLPLKVAIARKVAVEEPLNFDLAAAGLLGLPWNVAPRNPVVTDRARSIFLQIFRSRFEAAFPAGFLLRNRKDSYLQLDYRGASAGLQVNLGSVGKLGRLPDPATLTWTKLVAVAAQASSDLEPYAKMLAYHPERADSLLAVSVAPPEIKSAIAVQARTWVDGLARPIAKVRFGDLAKHSIGTTGTKWTIRHHRLVAEALTNMGCRLEPDPADGREPLEDSTEVVVISDPACLAPETPSFGVAATAAILVAGVARANDVRASEIEEGWLGLVQQRMGLSAGEVVRLRGRLQWLKQTNVGFAKVKRLVTGASATDRETVAWSAAVAAGGGALDRAQVAVLESVYDRLDVPRRSLYTTIHGVAAASATPAIDPITVAVDAPGVVHLIPRPPQPTGAGLDKERLQRVRLETERVASVLADIFVDESETAPEEPVGHDSEAGQFAGLDPAHASLVKRLVLQPAWPRTDFEAAAREAGLMPDGSIEAINEWAFDCFEEPLIEEGDILRINTSLLGLMTEPVGVA